MHNIQASAFRIGGTVEVIVVGQLADSCVKADIVDHYPGGRIVYARDPGAAQVFIREWREDKGVVCTLPLIDWIDHARFPDREHDTLQVFINNELALTTPIIELPINKKALAGKDAGELRVAELMPALAGEFIVTALLNDNNGKHRGCRIRPEGAVYPAIYRRVFGPTSYAQCSAYVAKNCDDPILFPPLTKTPSLKKALAGALNEAPVDDDGNADPTGLTTPDPGDPWPAPPQGPWPGPWPFPPRPWPEPPYPYPPPPWPYPPFPYPPRPWPDPPYPTPPRPWPGVSPFSEEPNPHVALSRFAARSAIQPATSASAALDRKDVEQECRNAIEKAVLCVFADIYSRPGGIDYTSRHVPAETPVNAQKGKWGTCLAKAVIGLNGMGYANLSIDEDDVDETHIIKFRKTAKYLAKKIRSDQ